MKRKMVWAIPLALTLIGVGLFLIYYLRSGPEDTPEEAETVRWIKAKGGSVGRTDSHPGSPVDFVSLRGTSLTTREVERILAFRNLRQLRVDETSISDDLLRALRARAALHLLRDQCYTDERARADSDANIQHVTLQNGLVTDAGLKELDDLKGLRSLALGWGITGEGLKLVADRHRQLRELSVAYAPIGDADLKALAPLADLHTLNLNGTKVGDAGLKELAPLVNLQTLNLSRTKVGDTGLTELRPLVKLRFLNLAWTQVTGAGIKELAPLTNLRKLDFYNDQITDEVLRSLREIELLHALNVCTTPKAGRESRAISAQEVENVSLYATKVTDAGLKELTPLEHLQRLALNDRVTDAGMKTLGHWKQLRSLTLGAGVSSRGLKELADLGVLRQLSTLTCAGSRVGDSDMKLVAGLEGLTDLTLNYTRVTDVGLAELATLKRLNWLRLEGSPVTDAGMATLKRSLPKTNISR